MAKERLEEQDSAEMCVYSRVSQESWLNNLEVSLAFFLAIIIYKYSTDYTLPSKTTRHMKVPPFSELHLSRIEDPKAA